MDSENLKIVEILNRDYSPITLEEMDSVTLMDRIDTKYIFHITKLSEILNSLNSSYRVLEVKGYRISSYKTLYYDTPSFDLYLRHHNGIQNRYKIRSRNYVESDLHFFEIKFKNNKLRSIKKRIAQPHISNEISHEASELLEKITGINVGEIVPSLWVNYSRITLVGIENEERLTIDLNLEYILGERRKKFDNLVIAELKRDIGKNKSAFYKKMMQEKIRPHSISKYCLGITQLVDDIKKNNFKPQIYQLNKLLYDNP